jgi:hypothetical protein
MVEGLHIPLIPSKDAGGKFGAVEFRQNGPIGAKVGMTSATTLKSRVAIESHPEGIGIDTLYNPCPG